MHTAAAIRKAVRDVLGHDDLRPGQREAIDAALTGDTLAVLATGTGKTLVYRIVGALRGGLSVVVSPTLSLQHDQLRSLRATGPAADALNSELGARARREVLRRAVAGELGFLLLAPEQLARPDVVAALQAAPVTQVVVDEAHCVVEWGAEFRPDYLALPAVIAALGAPPVLALTATASDELRRAIASALRLREPAVVVGELDRTNIWLGARVVVDERAADEVAVTAADGLVEGAAALFYVATRRRVDELLERLAQAGISAVGYHGGLPRRRREQVHEGFVTGTTPVVVATSAFALGVDKPDVRLVVHVDPPTTLDACWQQIGRAGRYGLPAAGVVLSRPAGYRIPGFFASRRAVEPADVRAVFAAAPGTARELAAATGLSAARVRRAVNALFAVGAVVEDRNGVTPSPEVAGAVELAVDADERRRERETSGVELVRRYAETADCRRRLVLQLLGEDALEPCGRCDSCEAGTARPVESDGLRVGLRVRHPEWGDGVVEQHESDRVVVLFDEGGYRTLATAAALEHDLLVPA